MRLTEWPRMPFLNEEVKEWIALELESLGVEDRRLCARGRHRGRRATGHGRHRDRPPRPPVRAIRLVRSLPPRDAHVPLAGPPARVELRADTFRLWARVNTARDGRSASTIRTSRPPPSRTISARRSATSRARLRGDGRAVRRACRPCLVRRARRHPGWTAAAAARRRGPGGADRRDRAEGRGADRREGRPAVGETPSTAEAAKPDEAVLATAVLIGEGEEILQLLDEEREAIPTRSDDQS